MLYALVVCLLSCKDQRPSDSVFSTDPLIENKDTTSENIPRNPKATKAPVIKITQDNLMGFLGPFGSRTTQNKVLLKTTMGDIVIELFEETPLHRANFLYLTQMGYFDQTFFHRVVPNFIIQGGNSDNISTSRKRKALGNNYRLPSEVNPGRKHRYGTVSGPKEYRKNKEKMSAPYEFFIFLGPDTSTRHLNGEYTIFGQVIHGMDVVETIANLPTDSGEWPKTNVFIEAKIIN